MTQPTRKLTMGSLFDGISGFPLASVRYGIEPIWASEIEPFPILVSKIRFPRMEQMGDITKLNGAYLPPVDIICGGSPCQDLSCAGLRAGLTGARSGLFMEQIRIIQEMRDADRKSVISQQGKEYYYPVIKEQLDIRSEYLGFKYAIIHSNDLLKHDFGDMTIWNKKGE